MTFEPSIAAVAGLVVAGLVAGFVNTLAGGGSLLTLPALMFAGLPADVANGTNRVGILLQSVAATRAFDKAGHLERSSLLLMVLPTVMGAGAGAAVAATIPREALRPILLGTMVVMAVLFAARPSVLSPQEGEQVEVRESPSSVVALALTGFYGGFLQAGMGFLMLAILAGKLRYDLVAANAIKMLAVAVLTVVALTIFLIAGQVEWIPGLIVGAASVVGSLVAVRFATRASSKALRWIVVVAVFGAVVGLLVRG